MTYNLFLNIMVQWYQDEFIKRLIDVLEVISNIKCNLYQFIFGQFVHTCILNCLNLFNLWFRFIFFQFYFRICKVFVLNIWKLSSMCLPNSVYCSIFEGFFKIFFYFCDFSCPLISTNKKHPNP
jgi:hypothetical protein